MEVNDPDRRALDRGAFVASLGGRDLGAQRIGIPAVERGFANNLLVELAKGGDVVTGGGN